MDVIVWKSVINMKLRKSDLMFNWKAYISGTSFMSTKNGAIDCVCIKSINKKLHHNKFHFEERT